jgi:hypothetical protein
MISVLVSGQSPGLPENFSPPMPVMPDIVGGRCEVVNAALPVCAVCAARLRRVWSASEAAGSRGSSHLERRPSSLGLDHGWCVYSKLGKACCRRPLFLTESQRHFTACTLKKRQRCSQHFSGVHIVSLPLGLHVLVSKSIHTHKHVRTYNYAPIRDTSSLKTAPRSLPT